MKLPNFTSDLFRTYPNFVCYPYTYKIRDIVLFKTFLSSVKIQLFFQTEKPPKMIQAIPSTSKEYGSSLKVLKTISKRRRKSSITLSSLPDDVLIEIVQRLKSVKDVNSMKAVNHRLNKLINNNGYRFVRSEIDGLM